MDTAESDIDLLVVVDDETAQAPRKLASQAYASLSGSKLPVEIKVVRQRDFVGVAVLVNAGRSKHLHPSRKVVNELKKRHGHELETLLSVAPEAFTANEASYLIGFRSLDEIRNRIIKARKETNLRLRSKGISRMEDRGR